MATDDEPGPDAAAGDPPAGAAGRFSIQKLYLKDVSFETPNSPAVFRDEWKPDVELQLNNDANRIDEGLYEVVVRVTATASVGERTAFLVEVQQAGVFAISGVEDTQLKPLLGSYCPSVLFPYAREAVSDLVTRGGFPQFLLAPVNFDALYAQHLEQERQAAAATGDA